MYTTFLRNEWRITRLVICTIAAVSLGLCALLAGLVFFVSAGLAIVADFVIVLTLCGAVVGINIYLLANYYHSMHGKRAYFTMTLPAKPSALFRVHTVFMLLVNIVVSAVTLIITTVAILLTLVHFLDEPFPTPTYIITHLFDYVPPSFLLYCIAYWIAGLLSAQLMYQAAITLGCTPPLLNMGKIPGSIIALLAIYAVNFLLGSISLIIPGGWYTNNLSAGFVFDSFFNSLGTTQEFMPIASFFASCISISLLYWLCTRALDRRLSVH